MKSLMLSKSQFGKKKHSVFVMMQFEMQIRMYRISMDDPHVGWVPVVTYRKHTLKPEA